MSEAGLEITIESDALSSLRNDIDGMISRALKTMHMTNNGEATVTAKIKITLNNEMTPTPDGVRKVVRPVFEHEVQSVVQAKDKMTGTMNGEYELVYDADQDKWYMKSTRNQVSMFDEDAQMGDEPAVVQVNGYIEEPVACLPEAADEEDDYEPDEDSNYEPDYGPEE